MKKYYEHFEGEQLGGPGGRESKQINAKLLADQSWEQELFNFPNKPNRNARV